VCGALPNGRAGKRANTHGSSNTFARGHSRPRGARRVRCRTASSVAYGKGRNGSAVVRFEHPAAQHYVDNVVDLGRIAQTAHITQSAATIITIEDDLADFSPASVVWAPRPRHAETVRRGGGSKSFSLYEIDSAFACSSEKFARKSWMSSSVQLLHHSGGPRPDITAPPLDLQRPGASAGGRAAGIDRLRLPPGDERQRSLPEAD